MNSSSSLLVPEFLQMTVLNLVLRGTIFTEGGHYSPVNNVRGDIFGGDTIHYDNVTKMAESYYFHAKVLPCLPGRFIF